MADQLGERWTMERPKLVLRMRCSKKGSWVHVNDYHVMEKRCKALESELSLIRGQLRTEEEIENKLVELEEKVDAGGDYRWLNAKQYALRWVLGEDDE